MQLDSDSLKMRVDELNGKRKPLSEQFERNPDHTRLALEIRIIDDQIAECTLQMQADRRKRK
jgi:hypothetical protein